VGFEAPERAREKMTNQDEGWGVEQEEDAAGWKGKDLERDDIEMTDGETENAQEYAAEAPHTLQHYRYRPTQHRVMGPRDFAGGTSCDELTQSRSSTASFRSERNARPMGKSGAAGEKYEAVSVLIG